MRAHPWLWIGLWKDRACSRCRIGFRPPRPVWAKVLYLGSLVTLATLLATSAGIAIVPDWHPPWVDTLWLPVTFLAANVFLLLLCMRD